MPTVATQCTRLLGGLPRRIAVADMTDAQRDQYLPAPGDVAVYAFPCGAFIIETDRRGAGHYVACIESSVHSSANFSDLLVMLANWWAGELPVQLTRARPGLYHAPAHIGGHGIGWTIEQRGRFWELTWPNGNTEAVKSLTKARQLINVWRAHNPLI